MKLNQNFVRRIAFAAAPAIALVVYACTQPLTLEDVLVRPETMAAVGSLNVTATVAQVVSNPAQVLVKDQDGEPLANQNVSFVASKGTLSSPTATTNAQGQAAPATWTAPNQSGPGTITVSIPGFNVPQVTFTVTINAGAPATQSKTATTDNQSAIAGAAVANAPEVTVVDQFGNGVPNVAATFTVLTGGGTVNGSSLSTVNVTTDANGKAKLTSWFLGTSVGSNTLRATTSVLPGQPLTFTATGTVGPVNKIVIAPPGNSQNQTATRGTNVAVSPVVLVTDVNNNPINNIGVRFSIGVGGGKVIASDNSQVAILNVTSNASGIATTNGWLLWGLGSNTILVTIPSAPSVATFTITATATPAAPATIAAVTETPSSQGQTAVVGSAVPVAPGAIVLDADGFPVPGTNVTFTVGASSGTIKTVSGGPSVTNASFGTDANGVARLFSWTLGNRGANTLAVAVTATPAINFTFNATGTAGPPASIEISTGNNQSTIANTATPIAPKVLVKDASGLTVDAGYNIAFTITNGGGVVSATGCTGSATTVVVPTIADGTAEVGCWKPGTIGTANSLRASVVATPSIFVTFIATGTTGPPTQVVFTNLPWPYTRISTANLGVPKVKVMDAGGNGLGSQTIAWSPGTNSTVTGTGTSPTNASGEATWPGGTAWNANGAVGSTMQLNATVQATAITAQTTSIISNPPNVIVQVTAAPATTLVNANVSPNPVLETRDTDGRPAPGAPLTWAYTVNPGGTSTGSLTGSPAATDSVGRASPGTWKVASTAGVNTIQATLVGPNVTVNHSTTGIAGTAANIGVNTGNNQSAAAGTAVATPPSVVVRDAFGNLAGPGVSVTFQPAAGSGSVTGSPTTTNGSSIATVGSWTLGAAGGAQTLNAFLTANSSVTTSFNATALDPCDNGSTAHTLGTTGIAGTLAATDCNLVNESGTGTKYGDVFRITVPAATTRFFRVQLSSAAFGPQIRSYVYAPANSYWYNTNTTPATITSYYVLGPGVHDIVATSDAITTTGNYTFGSDLNPAMPTGCGDFVVTKGIAIGTHSLVTSNCTYTYNGGSSPVASRRYLIYLPSGQSATVSVSGATVDWYLEAYDISGTRTFLSFIDNASGGGSESLVIASSASANRFIEIRVAHWQTTPLPAGTYPFNLNIP